MTSILAAIGAGFGVRWAARKMKMRQHPFFEDHSRIAANYEEYHNRGILDDAGYFIGMLKLKQWRQFYGPVLPGLRDPVLPASQGAAEAREKSQSGFEVDMSREEARQVLGMTTAEMTDLKSVQKKFRRLMLKNHPDIGGSAYLASKINEAKEILMGEKVPKGEVARPREDQKDESPEDAEERQAKAREAAQQPDLMTYRAPKEYDILEDDVSNWKSAEWYRSVKGKPKPPRRIDQLF